MSTPATRLVMVRHGEAEGNRELRYLGSTDVSLTTRGERQALDLAQALLAYHITAIYTSPLLRTRQTAQAIHKLTGHAVSVVPDLREEDFGAWEMRTRADVLASDPERLEQWERGESIAPPGGESLSDVRTRVVALASLLAARHPGATITLVSHVSPIKALVCAALGLPPSGARRMWLDPASISVVEWRAMRAASGAGDSHRDSETEGIVRLFNASGHLGAPAPWLAQTD